MQCGLLFCCHAADDAYRNINATGRHPRRLWAEADAEQRGKHDRGNSSNGRR